MRPCPSGERPAPTRHGQRTPVNDIDAVGESPSPMLAQVPTRCRRTTSTIGGTRAARGAVVMTHRSRKGLTPRSGSRCRITLDLSQVPWGADADAAEALLRRRPGVLDVTVDTRRRTAVVVHDGRSSLPQLWNWLRAESGCGGT